MLVIISASLRNFPDFQGGAQKKFFGCLNPLSRQKIRKRTPCGLLDQSAQIVRAHCNLVADRHQGQILIHIPLINHLRRLIAEHRAALLPLICYQLPGRQADIHIAVKSFPPISQDRHIVKRKMLLQLLDRIISSHCIGNLKDDGGHLQ